MKSWFAAFTRVGVATLCAVFATSCVGDMPTDDLDDIDEVSIQEDNSAQEDDAVTEAAEEAIPKAATCSNRWAPQDQPRAVSYDSSGRTCSGGPTSGARALGDHIRSRFGNLMNLSVPGRGVQIYNCRPVNGGQSLSLHGEGRAVDVFIPTRSGGNSDNAKGDVIANWLIANSERIGVQMIIWDRTIWNASRSPQHRCYTGRHPHNDHIHIELTRAGAASRTPFFSNPNDDVDQDDPPPNNTPSSDWIGESCQRNSDCGFTSGGQSATCFKDHDPADGIGFCTLSCQGYCPDKRSHATTFCVSAEDLGGARNRGVCVQRSASANNQCRSLNDMTDLEMSRYVGSSSASNAELSVCVPVEVLELEDTPEPPQGNNVCQDTSLPLSDHNRSCDGFGENHWRCACSEGYEVSVSQVCRGGRWINYDTNPRDCSRCDGRYSSSCEGR